MRLLGKTAIVLGMAGAMALGSMTASEARDGRNAAIAAGVAGFAAGAAIGARRRTPTATITARAMATTAMPTTPAYTSYGYSRWTRAGLLRAIRRIRSDYSQLRLRHQQHRSVARAAASGPRLVKSDDRV